MLMSSPHIFKKQRKEIIIGQDYAQAMLIENLLCLGMMRLTEMEYGLSVIPAVI